jgi:arylsulfatase A-like enzyme
MTDVLLITVDSLRADHVGCYGYERETTPNLDSRVDDSAVYTNAYSHACSTRPSFPTILTSSYPLMYGGYERLSESRTLISEIFSDAGYRTAGLHSNAYLNPEFGYGRGFNHIFDSMTDPGTLARLRQWVKNRLDNEGVVYRALASAFDTAERRAGANIGSAYVDADEITDRAISWLRQDTKQPTFLWVHYMDVHHPYLPPTEHQEALRDEPLSEQRAIQLRRKFIERPEEITDSELSDITDLYDAEIRFTDSQVSRLLEAADEELGDYVFAFTSDHGEELREHGRFSHHATFYDEVLHVPLILNDGDNTGRHNNIVGLLDVAPSLAGAADLEIPDRFFGYDLQRYHGGTWPRNSVLGDWSSDGQGDSERRYSYRDDEWKFICYETGDDHHEELYRLSDDPQEASNIIAEHPAVVTELRETIKAHADDIAETNEELKKVEMDEQVRQQLRDLGYQE